MARNHSPKERQQKQLERKRELRAPCARILIVSEGSKTEPLYFEDMRIDQRLPQANIAVSPSNLGTEPLQVVKYAKQLFEEGDKFKSIEPRAFEYVYAVFDRDDHLSYFDALQYAESLDNTLPNDSDEAVRFQAIASVPCFELWLLLHYEDIQAPLHRDEVVRRLKKHIPDYKKGLGSVFATTRKYIDVATKRALRLAVKFNARSDGEPYTGIVELITLVTKLQGK